jgi:beta-lactamase superfamily II metal-dependent hydrolase
MANLKISFLDVGHGDFIYCETPLGENMLIDCGYGDVIPSKFLSKVTTINELQISHPHTDHFDDIIDVSTKTIKSFRCPKTTLFKDDKIGWKKKDADKLKKLREIEKNVPVDNNAIKTDKTFDHIVWAPSDINYDDPNTSSLITILTFNGFKILLGGDLPNEGWLKLLGKKDFVESIKGTTILKASHHGRDEGYCSELFDVISPKLCIISDKALDKDNKSTVATDKYSSAIKKNGGGMEFVYVSTGISAGISYVLTTRKDKSIFMDISGINSYNITTHTTWK